MIGFVNVNKPSGLGSSKVVAILKKYYNTKKIGHMGTLDPLAEGVLPIAIGKATRMFDYMLDKHKTYVAEFTFGATTDTLDSEGNVTETTCKIPTADEISVILPQLTGKISQIPPQYSAKKVNGKCAYSLARMGQVVELKPKEIEIYRLELIRQINDNTFQFLIECSGGTYIRSIARDMASLLDSKAYMSKLVRETSGKFDLKNSYSLEQLKEKSLSDVLVKVEDVFDFDVINLNETLSKALFDGKIVKIGQNDGLFFVKCETMLLGIGEVSNKILKLKTNLKEDV